ncbi:MAG TPA: glycosyltransferase, partial [Chitinophagaceae bacterium]|nr:glycosyltransferase [Chitinophagaceae bacterium]
MPRILRIFNRLILGGPAFNVTFLTKYLEPEFETKLIIGAKEDHEQEATFLKEQYHIAPVEVPNMKRPIHFSDDWKAYKDIKKIIQEYKPHIVHTHAAKPGAIGRLAASACNVPVILHTFHGHVFHSYFGKAKSQLFVQAERYLASKTDRIIAISDIQKNELAHQFKICNEKKIAVVPLGIDLQKFYEHREEKRQAFRLKYGINENEIAIGIIGRIVGVKNHAMFLSAIKQVLQSTQKQIRVIIVGDGDLRNDLMNQLSEAKISFNYFPDNQKPGIVTFTSWLTNMDEVYAG